MDETSLSWDGWLNEDGGLPFAAVRFAPRGRRLFAFVIDVVVLVVVGALLGLLLHEQLVRAGGWGRVIGFAIVVGYFGAANSSLFGGHTLGKAVTGIRVVGVDGEPISLPRSLARGAILWIPYFLNEATLGTWAGTPWGGSLFAVLVVGGTFALVYLFVFNGPSRRSLHDLVVGSMVVVRPSSIEASEYPVASLHLAVVGLVVIVSVCAPLVLYQSANAAPLLSVLAAADSVASEAGAHATHVGMGSVRWSTMGGVSGAETYLQVQITLRSRKADLDKLGNQIVSAIFATYHQAESRDVIAVQFRYGFDLGIWSWWWTEPKQFAPTQWRERIVKSLARPSA